MSNGIVSCIEIGIGKNCYGLLKAFKSGEYLQVVRYLFLKNQAILFQNNLNLHSVRKKPTDFRDVNNED